MAQCTATSKRSGERCKKDAVIGRKTCHMHGGRNRVGVAAPGFKHGRYSAHLPSRLAARFAESVSDPELLNLTHEIALIDARLEDVIARVDAGGAMTLWAQLESVNGRLNHARRSGDTTAIPNIVAELSRLITAGNQEAESWIEVQTLVESRRRLVETERKRRVDMQTMVTADQAMLLVAALTESVRRHVRDKDTLRSITNDFARITEATGGAQY